jgi:NAD(P)H-flavin reductase
MRAYAQWLFPENGPDRSNGKDIWLVYGTRYETDIYYYDEFAALARRAPNFHYLPTLSRAQDNWPGLRGHVQVHISKVVEERAKRLGLPLPSPPVNPETSPAELKFDAYSYICGLNFMVSGVRDLLTGYGWHKKQIVFERYD